MKKRESQKRIIRRTGGPIKKKKNMKGKSSRYTWILKMSTLNAARAGEN